MAETVFFDVTTEEGTHKRRQGQVLNFENGSMAHEVKLPTSDSDRAWSSLNSPLQRS